MKKITVLAYDIGTTGVKTCLFEIGERVDLISFASAGYQLYVLKNGGAEQDPDEWWQAMCETTEKVIAESGVSPESISGISFCSQMQGLVLVDKDGVPVRRAMSYMDQRAEKQLKDGIANGVRIAGANVVKLLKSLKITGAVAASVKDPVWKYKWVEENEPENFARAYKWLDVKEAIICRMTGEMIMTHDSAFATLLYDIKKREFSKEMCSMLNVNLEHLPRIIECSEKAGVLKKEAAEQLGLAEGIPVYGGGGDASLIAVASGAVLPGDTHVYWGTSGWVGTVVEKSIVDATAMVAAIVGAEKGKYNYFAELETAGKCLEWAKNRIALDAIGVYKAADENGSVYDKMTEAASKVPAGSNGVIFAPYLHGNRCPFEAPDARGMFFNLSLETTEAELIRAVIEGVCFHIRWFLETEDKKVKTSSTVRFAGGGAISPFVGQTLADCTGKTVETVKSPQNAGSVGAAVLVAVGEGVIKNIGECKKLIPAENTFTPNRSDKAAYDKSYKAFKKLYFSNKKLFSYMNDQ
ncbi:MAG: FGGY-family carbohydrate kinase [Clostridiales bacterium]|nr:FGGY-family carbohydrate kinase [Clostridiales bacterium]